MLKYLGLNHIADEGVWVPFFDDLQEVKHSFDMDNEREQYGIQNDLNLGEQIYDNYQCKTMMVGTIGDERDYYQGIVRLPQKPIKSKHIWNVRSTSGSI